MAQLQTLTLSDMSDRELLLVLNDVADTDGWALAKDLVERVGINPEHGHRNIAIRLSWLRRFGAVERELLWDENGNPIMSKGKIPMQRSSQRWRLSAKGKAIAMGKLNPNQQKMLENIAETQMVVAMREMGNKYRKAEPVSAKLTEREWRYGMTRVNGSRPA